MNPLLDFSGLPRFDAVTPEHVAPAIRELIAENRALVEKLAAPESQPSWHAFMQPITDAGERLGRAWGIVSHLHSVMDVPAWRDAYNAMLPEITGYYAELGQNEAIYAKVKQLRASAEYATLTPTRQRIVDNDLRDFRLSGAELSEDKKPRYKAMQEEMSAIAAKFSENLLDATNAHVERITDEAQLAGIPEDVKAAARKDDAWELTLRAPCYIPVMQYAENRELRARMYRAFATRASEFGQPEWDNGPLITRLLHLRAEEAALLGYAHYAEVSLVPKMAESTAQVAGFLRELAAKAKPFAERDVAELREFARTELGMDRLESWDLAWASEKLKQARYAFSDEEVKQYFPEHKVMAGLFKVIGTLFSVNIEPDSAPTWHPDVRFYRIVTKVSRGDTPAGTLVGRFYVDLYARETKRGGAWMADAIGRRQTPAGIQTPVAYLNCNFPAPVNGKAATFSHAQPVHGELLLGMGRARWHDRACQDRRAAAARPLRQNDRGEEFPERHADAAPDRVRAVRPAAAQRIRPRRHAHRAGIDPGRARGSGGCLPARVEPLPAELRPHLRRRLRGGLLQLQMGGSPFRRRLCRFRGSGQDLRQYPRRRNRRALLARNSGRRRFAAGDGIVQGLPRPRAGSGCLVAA